jgi:Ser/Thr protein kinase RdoA (MazF antagonist)
LPGGVQDRQDWQDFIVRPLGGGLINQTFLVSRASQEQERFVLQRVNPLFPAAIHDNIRAVTARLAQAGLTTPRLLAIDDGRPCLELSGAEHGTEPGAEPGTGPSVWRLMTYVDGVSFDVVDGPAQAHAAGALVARFHAALDGLTLPFSARRAGVHDTPRHLETLRRAVADHQGHRLSADVAPLADRILKAAAALPALPALPPRICHGDLKFNNLLFAGPKAPERDHAVCLVDLDTVAPMALAFELGDAWRSWCNRNGEDRAEADLNLPVFEASLDGYRGALGRDLGPDERRALLLGPEWISLELAARFAADALLEAYFGWDSGRFAGRGEHNLVRARGQFSLHLSLGATRGERARSLGIASGIASGIARGIP